jgi:hypothetical protein
MNLDEAAANFRRATRHCDNLIEIHRKHGGPRQGRRDKETSINRAVVVLTASAWQAVVQDMTKACLHLSDPGPTSPHAGMFKLLAGRTNTEIGAFSTPNHENSKKLLSAVGFDPRPHWAWTKPGRSGNIRPHQVEERINQWLKVRHAIAHGHDKLPSVSVLHAVREAAKNPPDDPSLRLIDVEQCLAFFRQLAQVTGKGLATHLQVAPPADWA